MFNKFSLMFEGTLVKVEYLKISTDFPGREFEIKQQDLENWNLAR